MRVATKHNEQKCDRNVIAMYVAKRQAVAAFVVLYNDQLYIC